VISSGFEELSRDDKIGALAEVLLLTEMGMVNPSSTYRYPELRSKTVDEVALMELELAWARLVANFRNEGKVSSVEKLRLRAEEMVDYSPDQMREALLKHASEFQQRLKSSRAM
jgi:hypothetical protein